MAGSTRDAPTCMFWLRIFVPSGGGYGLPQADSELRYRPFSEKAQAHPLGLLRSLALRAVMVLLSKLP